MLGMGIYTLRDSRLPLLLSRHVWFVVQTSLLCLVPSEPSTRLITNVLLSCVSSSIIQARNALAPQQLQHRHRPGQQPALDSPSPPFVRVHFVLFVLRTKLGLNGLFKLFPVLHGGAVPLGLLG